MKDKIKQIRRILLALGLYLISLAIVYFDQPEFKYRWIAFSIYIAALLILIIRPLKIPKKITRPKFSFRPLIKFLMNNKWVIIAFLIIFVSRFLLLNEYPFNGIGDELRDGGLLSDSIINGQIKNIFGYGPYNGFGLTSPLLLIPFHWIFPASTMAFKFPAAICSFFEILFIFLVIKNLFSKKAGIITALIAASLPVSMYYARTETLIIECSLVSGALIYLTYKFFISKNPKLIFPIGIVMGLSLGLHASIRPVVFLTIIFVILFILIKKIGIKYILMLLILVLISFGPQLLFSTPETFFNSSKITFTFSELLGRYWSSIGVYSFAPTTSFFYLQAPILNAFYTIIFLFGVLEIIRRHNYFSFYILAGLLLLPLTNSAITNAMNADHRILVVVPFVVTAIGYGINIILSRLENHKIVNISILVLFTLVALINIYNVFNDEYISYSMFLDTRGTNYQNYLSTYLGLTVKNDKALSGSQKICVVANKQELEHKTRMHVREYLNYVLAYKTVDYKEVENMPDRTVGVALNCDYNFNTGQYSTAAACDPYKKFICPQDQQPIYIRVYK